MGERRAELTRDQETARAQMGQNWYRRVSGALRALEDGEGVLKEVGCEEIPLRQVRAALRRLVVGLK